MAIAVFVNGAKGHAALHLSRDLNVQYKTAFVLAHKLREAMGAEVHNPDQPELSGTVEIDGMYAGGNVKPANKKADRVDRRLAEEQTGKRQVVVVAREIMGRTLPFIVPRESDAVPLVRQHVASGTIVHADESNAWERLHASYDMRRVNHSAEYVSEDGASVNQAESFFSRLRRAEYGVHHRISSTSISTQTRWLGVRTTAASRWHAIPVRDRCGATPCEIGSLARLLAEGRSMTASKDHIETGLIEKRRELAGVIDDMQRRLDQHRADLTHIDGTLRVLATDLDPDTIRPKRAYRRNRYFARNELSRLCLGVLRTAAGELLSTDDIASRVIIAKGFDGGDAILRAAIREQVGSTVKRLHRNGAIDNIGAGRASNRKLAGV